MATADEPEQLHSMTFGEHLEELRRRVIYALLGVAVALGLTLYYGRSLIAFIYAPLAEVQRLADLPTQTYTRSALSGFTIYVKVSLVGALLLASPWVVYQLWRFVEAGLYATERRAAGILMVLSGAMTALGLAFMYFLLLPAYLAFMIFFTTTYPVNSPKDNAFLHWISKQFIVMNANTMIPGAKVHENAPAATGRAGAGDETLVVPTVEEDPAAPVEGQMWFNRERNEVRIFQGGRVRVVTLTAPAAMIPLIDPSDYINEVTWLSVVCVVIFHVPVVMAFLGMVGIGNPDWLAKKRKFVIFGLFVAALFLTPSNDLFSDIGLPVLAWWLFELGLVLMRLFGRRRKAAAELDG